MAGRRRAAVELIAGKGAELRATAARFSLCADDVDDAYQRALEILLRKAPTDDPRDLLRWSKTVIKHEALAVRANRERLLGRTGPWAEDEDGADRAAREPSREESPEERCERDEDLARKREALRSLKPAEMRSLTLRAAGYSHAEIAERTGYSRRKVDRSLAEGRERFRALVARGEDGSRCEEMGPLLSAYCDGEAAPEQARAVREHLRACAGCRAAMRAYRAAPATVAALAPALPASRSLLERAQELVVAAQARLPGGASAAEAGAAQTLAAGGTRGGGMAALAKLLTVCAGTAGAGAACVAGGVAPPLGLVPDGGGRPAEVRQAASASVAPATVDYEPAPEAEPEPPSPAPDPEPEPQEPAPAPEPAPEPAPATEAGAVEYAPPPEPAPAPAASSSGAASGASSGSAAGEFGP